MTEQSRGPDSNLVSEHKKPSPPNGPQSRLQSLIVKQWQSPQAIIHQPSSHKVQIPTDRRVIKEEIMDEGSW